MELEQRDRHEIRVSADRVCAKRSEEGRVAIGPINVRIQLEDTYDVAIQRSGATNITAKAKKEDLRPHLSSSNSLKHT